MNPPPAPANPQKPIYKFKFSGKSKRGQNNKVLQKLRNQKKGVPVS